MGRFDRLSPPRHYVNSGPSFDDDPLKVAESQQMDESDKAEWRRYLEELIYMRGPDRRFSVVFRDVSGGGHSTLIDLGDPYPEA